MKSLFWILALFIAAAAIALLAHFNEGYVLFVVPPYRAEVSFNFALLGLFVGFVACYAALRALTLAFSLPERTRLFREQRRDKKALTLFLDAQKAYLEGDYLTALKKAKNSHSGGLMESLTTLLAAAAEQAKDPTATSNARFEQAVQATPSLKIGSLMLEATLALNALRVDDALSALNALEAMRLSPEQRRAKLHLEMRAKEAQDQPDDVLRIVRLLENQQLIAQKLAEKMRFNAHFKNLYQRLAQPDDLARYWDAIPPDEMTDALKTVYATLAPKSIA